MGNKSLTDARRAKNDEFYTQFSDIQKEVSAYLEYNPNVFRGKVVYCNCDDPYESNFFRYFVLNFKHIGLKQLITTSYKPSPIANTQIELFGDHPSLPPSDTRPKITANRFCIINDVEDIDGDREFTLQQIAERLQANKHNEWAPLEGDGDFRSDESIALLKQSDIVVTNPPFSLFREYFKQLVDFEKKFLIIGNINCISYNEVFQQIKRNEIWLGNGMGRWISGFIVPESYELYGSEAGIDKEGNRIVATNNCLWLTNLDHGRRHQRLPLISMEDNKKFNAKIQKNHSSYQTYENYNAIEVPYTNAIPSDYDGVMGVPITFLDKYNPEQFEILGLTHGNDDSLEVESIRTDPNRVHGGVINGQTKYARILIKSRG